MKMKKMMKMLCGLAMAVLCLVGCGTVEAAQEERKPAVCFVIANTANAQAVNFESPLIEETILDCALNYGYLTVINCDGNNEVVIQENFDIEERFKKASAERLEMDARNTTTGILIEMQTIIADDPEVDYLEALRSAARVLASLEGYTSKTIVVCGTGLNSTGYMNFGNNLLFAEAETVADLLEEKGVIPDFKDITIYWQGMADVASPQQTLSPAQRIKLQDIWAAVIQRGKGQLVTNEFLSKEAETTKEYLPVSIIELPNETPVSFDADTFAGGENVLETPMVLTEEQVMFIPDEAEYKDLEAAALTLEPVAEYMKQNKDVSILLAGTTAGDVNSETAIELSRARAATVKDTLINLGVDAERILVVGLGCENPWHIRGLGYDGLGAEQNRRVVIMNAESEQAKSMLGQ